MCRFQTVVDLNLMNRNTNLSQESQENMWIVQTRKYPLIWRNQRFLRFCDLENQFLCCECATSHHTLCPLCTLGTATCALGTLGVGTLGSTACALCPLFLLYNLCIVPTVPIVQPVHTGSAQVAFLFKIRLVSKMPTEMTAILLIAMIEILSKGQGRDFDNDDNDKNGLLLLLVTCMIASYIIKSFCRI